MGGCQGQCETNAFVELQADQELGLVKLDTDVRAFASSGERGSDDDLFPEDACGSSDTDIVKYRWDLDGDGKYEISRKDGDIQHVTFTEPGDHLVRVEVEDRQGSVASHEITLTVLVQGDLAQLESVYADVRAEDEDDECPLKVCLYLRAPPPEWVGEEQFPPVTLDVAELIDTHGKRTLFTLRDVVATLKNAEDSPLRCADLPRDGAAHGPYDVRLQIGSAKRTERGFAAITSCGPNAR